jgi:hypothetical protein
MTVEDTDKIDRIALERASGKVLLVISDHLPWDIDEGQHLVLLQAKVNRHLDAIESGELYRRFPLTRGRSFVIVIYSLFELSQDGRNLVGNLKNGLAEMGIELRWILFEADAAPSKPVAPN